MKYIIIISAIAVVLYVIGIATIATAQKTRSDKSSDNFLDIDLAAMRAKAVEAYNTGDYEQAADLYLSHLRHNVDDNVAIYNLACCYGLMYNAEMAGKYLKQAFKAGFNDIELMKHDTDFAGVKEINVFAAVYDSLINDFERDRAELGSEIFFDACAIFRCRSHLPENFDKTKTYPLVIGLHGYGGNADYMIRLWRHFNNPEFIYVTPYGPYHFMMGNTLAYSWNLWLTAGEEFPGKDFNITENYIIKLINDLKSVYNIGDIYLLGHSQGASTAYIMGIRHHEMFKGIISISGPLNSFWLNKAELDAGNNLNILIVHGKKDREIMYAEGVAAGNLLKNHGYKFKFVDHDGGHELPPDDIMKQIGEWIEKNK